MLAIDTNILVYAHRREAAEHEVAKELLAHLTQGREHWAIPWPCIYEFFSVVTNARIWKQAASSPVQASDQLDAWMAAPSLQMIGETADYWPILSRFMRHARVRGPVVHDARVAAICLSHGVQALVTRDRDFSLFPELGTQNPFG